MFYKDIICLANSRKMNGRCVAGKDVEDSAWIRPLSPLSKTGELTLRDITYEDWTEVKVLDIIRIPFKRRNPKFYQPEDIEMSKGIWKKVGAYAADELDKICDNPEHIWLHGDDNDRIDVDFLSRNSINSSLLFIKSDTVLLINEAAYGKQKLKCCFNYNDITYRLSVTDPVYEKRFKSRPPGTYKLKSSNIYLCISLSEPYRGYCYKLAAAIVRG